jgi:hypothetical protein
MQEKMDASSQRDKDLYSIVAFLAVVLSLAGYIEWWTGVLLVLFTIPGYASAHLYRRHLHQTHVEPQKAPTPQFYNTLSQGSEDNFSRFCGGHQDVILLEVMRFVGSNVKDVRATSRKLCRAVISLRPQRRSLREFELNVAGHYPALQCLDLSFSQDLKPAMLCKVLRNFPNLRKLVLTSIATDPLLRVVARECKVLEAIDLSGALNLISDCGLALLGNCEKLCDLNLTQCWTVGDQGLKAVVDKRALQIRRLVLRNNFWVTNDTVHIITRCSHLRVLDLSSGRPSPHLPSLKGRVLQLGDTLAYFTTDEQAVGLKISEMVGRLGGMPSEAQQRTLMQMIAQQQGTPTIPIFNGGGPVITVGNAAPPNHGVAPPGEAAPVSPVEAVPLTVEAAPPEEAAPAVSPPPLPPLPPMDPDPADPAQHAHQD